MKNLYKLLGIAVLAMAIVFSFAACNNPTSNGNSSNDTPSSSEVIGDKLSFSGQQVYTYTTNTNGTVSFSPYTGADFTLDTTYTGGGSGEVKDGKLSFSIETPNNTTLLSSSAQSFFYYYDNVMPSNTSVKGTIISGLSDSSSSHYLFKVNATGSQANGTSEQIMYVYVDGDVTISGKAKTDSTTNPSITTKTKDTSLDLKKGWNPVCQKTEVSGTTANITMSLSNPSTLKWVCQTN